MLTTIPTFQELQALSASERFVLATEVRAKILAGHLASPEEVAMCLSIASLNLQERAAKRPKSRGVPTEAEAANPLSVF